jgi:phosphoglycerate dehydrogenase-like enzyme
VPVPPGVDLRWYDDEARDGLTSTGDALDSARFLVTSYPGRRGEFAATASMPQLEVAQILTAGFDHVLPLIPEPVLICNAGGVHDASTAELAVALILAAQRGIDDFARAMPDGAWRYARYRSLADAHVVVIGAGGVGEAIVQRLSGFEADVTVVATHARAGIRGVGDLPDLLPTADVVVLAVPLNDSTRRMVDAAFLARLPDGALIVNVARGKVVDTDALIVEVSAGRLRAALDVTDPEPLPADHPLWRIPGVLVSPHVGGNSTAFLPRARALVTDQLGRWAIGRPLRHVVRG